MWCALLCCDDVRVDGVCAVVLRCAARHGLGGAAARAQAGAIDGTGLQGGEGNVQRDGSRRLGAAGAARGQGLVRAAADAGAGGAERGGDGGHQPTASEEYETFFSETTWMMLLLR